MMPQPFGRSRNAQSEMEKRELCLRIGENVRSFEREIDDIEDRIDQLVREKEALIDRFDAEEQNQRNKRIFDKIRQLLRSIRNSRKRLPRGPEGQGSARRRAIKDTKNIIQDVQNLQDLEARKKVELGRREQEISRLQDRLENLERNLVRSYEDSRRLECMRVLTPADFRSAFRDI